MANNIEALRKQAKQQEEVARISYFSAMLNRKMPMLNQVQSGQATRAEYEAEFGETVAETLGQQFVLGFFQLVVQARNRMEAGLMSEEALLSIPGMPDNALTLDVAELMSNVKVSMATAAAEAVTKRAEAAADRVSQLKVEAALLPDQKGTTIPAVPAPQTTGTDNDVEITEAAAIPADTGKEGE